MIFAPEPRNRGPAADNDIIELQIVRRRRHRGATAGNGLRWRRETPSQTRSPEIALGFGDQEGAEQVDQKDHDEEDRQ
jgi:hypothetical protein